MNFTKFLRTLFLPNTLGDYFYIVLADKSQGGRLIPDIINSGIINTIENKDYFQGYSQGKTTVK